ncbi:hypothetical protein E0485_09885 [Paenibacillus albiflavus]|uniref:Uncharacterized protein n=1 Tax=Paenibacillus albiflavus TaxID=2545760 RepID=A0A4R4EE99_9BACL|nr:hypothetical protein [Paenibacillus albiflavus]TCZ77777.1 hypothetical protein E0485_09885 [Paenibacillus albiflavus]
MDWYTSESIAANQQAEIAQHAKQQWKVMSIFKPKRIHEDEQDSAWLYGKAIQVLQETLDSDNAELRLHAAEIVIKHQIKIKSTIRLSS